MENLKNLIKETTLSFKTINEREEKVLENEFDNLGRLVEFLRETGGFIDDETKELLKELIVALIELQGNEIKFYEKKVDGYWLSYMDSPEEFIRYPDVSGLSTAKAVAFLTTCFLKVPDLSVEVPKMLESINRGIRFLSIAFGEYLESNIGSNTERGHFTESLLSILARGFVPFYLSKSKNYRKFEEFELLLRIFIKAAFHLEQVYFLNYFRAYGKLPPELAYLEANPKMRRFLKYLHDFLYPKEKFYDEDEEELISRKLRINDLSVKRPELLEEIEKQFQKAYFSISFFDQE